MVNNYLRLIKKKNIYYFTELPNEKKNLRLHNFLQCKFSISNKV